jgi:hypothetical protein
MPSASNPNAEWISDCEVQHEYSTNLPSFGFRIDIQVSAFHPGLLVAVMACDCGAQRFDSSSYRLWKFRVRLLSNIIYKTLTQIKSLKFPFDDLGCLLVHVPFFLYFLLSDASKHSILLVSTFSLTPNHSITLCSVFSTVAMANSF